MSILLGLYKKLLLTRGMKIANAPMGEAGFVRSAGGSAKHVNTVESIRQDPIIDSLDPNGAIKYNETSRTYSVSGQMQQSVSSSDAQAIAANSMNERRAAEKAAYASSLSSPTGSYDNSWTQIRIGKSHAYVMSVLSSSDHEASSNNAFVSGTAQLELSAVPASATMYYSKQSKLTKLTYKLSASDLLPLTPAKSYIPSDVEYAAYMRGWSTDGTYLWYFNATSGSYRNNDYFNPALFNVNVAEYGKIRDVKVWVELIHDHRGGTGVASASALNPFWNNGTGDLNKDLRHGLQGLQIALRSPNVTFKSAHPLWNDPKTFGFEKHSNGGEGYRQIPELLKNSYLLWAGHAVEQDLGLTLSSSTSSFPDNDVTSSFVSTAWTGAYQIAVDKDGLPAVSAVSASVDSNWVILFKMNVIGSWSGSLVSSGSAPMFAYDSNNSPYVFFIGTSSGNRLHMAKMSSGSTGVWNSEVVDPLTSCAVGERSVACDSNNIPHVLYYDNTNRLVKHAFSGSSGWTSEVVSPGITSYSPGLSMVIDKLDVMHVSYEEGGIAEDASYFKLKYMRSGSVDGWTTEFVEEFLPGASNGATSIAVDSENRPCITFSTPGVYGISYAHSGSSGWEVYSGTLEPSLGFELGSRAIVINQNNLPNIVYKNKGHDGIWRIRNVRSGTQGWSIKTLNEDSVRANFKPSICIDYLGNDHITFTRGNVLYENSVYTKRRGITAQSSYYEFDTDIDMRTVFEDSSNVPNPRSLSMLYDGMSSTGPGSSSLQIDKVLRSGFYPSPTSASLDIYNYFSGSAIRDESSFLSGANFPWMLDARVNPGNFVGRSYVAAGSPPAGWLSAAGGVADVNEFPTTGSQLGPATIRPVYPLLDDVYVEKIYDEPSHTTSDPFPESRLTKIIGFRPGLRGTEVHGPWTLMIGNNFNFNGSGVPTNAERSGFWFRQFRIEFLVDQREDTTACTIPSKDRRFKRSSNVPSRPGKRLIDVVSGSAAWDIGINYVYADEREEYGRTVGLTNDTGSLDGSYAVFTQTVATASYDAGDNARIAQAIRDAVLNSRPLIAQDNTLSAHINRSGVMKTMRDFVIKKLAVAMSSSS